MIKMIVMDLDGTLLNDDKDVSSYTVSILKKCKETGIKVVIATGRSRLQAEKIIDLIKPDFSILNYGALILNENKDIIYNKLLSLETQDEINEEYMEVINGGKMNAIEIISKAQNIPLSEIAAFGDGLYDIEMIKNCGAGIAMKNAIDEVKNISKYICTDNNEDGVAKWIERNILQAEKEGNKMIKIDIDSDESMQEWFDSLNSSYFDIVSKKYPELKKNESLELENNFEVNKKIISATVGVFWFNEDFTDLKIDGKVLFDKNDLEKMVFRNPACNHASLDKDYLNRKRGRVFIEGGKVFVCVGKNCPIYDPVEYDSEKSPKIGTNLVIEKFNLEHFTDVIEIIQDLHWNGDGKSYKIDDKYLV
jgi:phosphoserine phosphatase